MGETSHLRLTTERHRRDRTGGFAPAERPAGPHSPSWSDDFSAPHEMPTRDQGRRDLDQEPMRPGCPWLKPRTCPFDICGLGNKLCPPSHEHAPARAVHEVDVVNFHADYLATDGGSELRTPIRGEDHVLVEHAHIDRQRDGDAIDTQYHPSDASASKQRHAFRPVQLDGGKVRITIRSGCHPTCCAPYLDFRQGRMAYVGHANPDAKCHRARPQARTLVLRHPGRWDQRPGSLVPCWRRW